MIADSTLKIKKWRLAYLLLIIPYFELGSITMLEQQGELLFVLLAKLYTGARILIDILCIIDFLKNRKLPASKVSCILIVYLVTGFFIQSLHGYVSLSTLLGFLNNVCFIYIVDKLTLIYYL